jgi:hypothetical protein
VFSLREMGIFSVHERNQAAREAERAELHLVSRSKMGIVLLPRFGTSLWRSDKHYNNFIIKDST